MRDFRSERNLSGLLGRLAKDSSGNTLAMIAAALVPLLAMVGGGIDMGRSYLSQTRLQQACDAGVLAARKKLGSAIVTSGIVPADAAAVGDRFFNLNFGSGSYGTANRTFQMTLEPDYAISGVATVDVPTTIMNVFGFANVDIAVNCEAKLNFSNTDVMFVLDTTGSMARTNPGDTEPKIEVLRNVVKDFHAQLEGSKTPGTRIRYGFLPYSTNVNVGGLLKPEWMVDRWNYQGRVVHDTGTSTTGPIISETWTYLDGDETIGTPYVGTACPADSRTWVETAHWIDSDGTENWEYTVNGTLYQCEWLDSTNRRITPINYVEYRERHSRRNLGIQAIPVMDWRYQTMNNVDVSALKNTGAGRMRVGDPIRFNDMGGTPNSLADMNGFFRGCIEERDTYEIDDYSNIDFNRALDLDVDRVPTPGNPATQWRPMLNEISWERSIDWNGNGSWSDGPADYQWNYLNAGWAGLSACPAAAQKLEEMNASDVSNYVDSLFAEGSTYHDIGMIWGTRLLSPTGLFAAENADLPNQATSRHLIFLTDGETAPLDLSYGTYGIEPLDKRRWSPTSGETLTEVVENRFTAACAEARTRNITIWVVSFGIDLNPVLSDCAGPGHSFAAQDAAELQDVFSKIAAQMGDLRISR
jgi:Flp pilus assembly protein TadG